jgi:hypothetical protein
MIERINLHLNNAICVTENPIYVLSCLLTSAMIGQAGRKGVKDKRLSLIKQDFNRFVICKCFFSKVTNKKAVDINRSLLFLTLLYF